ncbi:TRAP transporter small permease [Arenibacter sp. GZD96]|uniref:TRAP transporter small permease n=1 Tax=Aurantibrevibacter litoralis TaxID=3106030 RepID=UPI002AFF019C|nr:TRAP transporter small permease [Arenibacter sp. GZD-96]MEA1785200.1 TRAP transporter small permease [Arenibacter sp. GZD-96]
MTFRAKIDQLLERLLMLIMAIMTLNVLWQVFTRFVLGSPSSFTDELARYLMIWIGILGAAYVAGKNQHVAINLLPSKLSPKAQRKLYHFVAILVILFALLAFVVGGCRLVYISYLLGQQSPALQIPLAFVYLVIPVSGVLIMYYKIADLLKRS